LNKEEKQLYCKESLERIIQSVGQDLMHEFLEEHFGEIKEE
jgi:hypothetical protein